MKDKLKTINDLYLEALALEKTVNEKYKQFEQGLDSLKVEEVEEHEKKND